MADCVFCKIVAGEIPCHRVDEDDLTIAFMDIGQEIGRASCRERV